MGELNFFLGLQVKKMKHGSFLCQIKYCTKLIKKFGMKKCKEASTLMATSTCLNLDEKGKSVDKSRYRCIIGLLLYLTVSRQVIVLNVCLCARYQANPKESLMQSYPARALDRRLQVDWARDPREGPRVLMSLRVDFEPMS